MRILLLANSQVDAFLVRALRELNHVVEIRGAVEPPLFDTEENPDCVILDLSSPSPDWAARAAAAWPASFHIQVVDQDDQSAKVAALRAGADACHARPLEIREIGERLEAAARRSRGRGALFALSGPEQRLFIDGLSIPLTRREYQIVELLAREPGEALGAEEISTRIWGADEARDPAGVRACISRLSGRIERAHGWRLIRGERGRGYRLQPRPRDTD